MSLFWTSKKECATCEYWDGPRKITCNPRMVECESIAIKNYASVRTLNWDIWSPCANPVP